MIRVKDIILIGGFEVERRGTRAIVRRGMFDLAKTWHREFLPFHFRRGAERRYKYAERATAYMARKRFERKGPLIWTGRTRAQARVLFRVTGSYKTVTAKMTLPPYIRMTTVKRTFRGKRYVLPAMGAEITTIRSAELRFLTKRLERFVTAGFNKLKTRRVVKI